MGRLNVDISLREMNFRSRSERTTLCLSNWPTTMRSEDARIERRGEMGNWERC